MINNLVPGVFPTRQTERERERTWERGSVIKKLNIINLDYHCHMALYTFLVFFEFHRPTNMRQPVNEVKCIKN